MRALLIDGDARAALAVRMMLEADGFNVDCTGLARDALDRSQSSPYDLVLFDLVLPDMAGAELVRAMRGANPLRPLLVLSGADRQQASSTAMQAGADGFLAKPFSRKDLLARMRALLSTRMPPAQLRPAAKFGGGNQRTVPILGLSEMAPFQPRFLSRPVRLARAACH